MRLAALGLRPGLAPSVQRFGTNCVARLVYARAIGSSGRVAGSGTGPPGERTLRCVASFSRRFPGADAGGGGSTRAKPNDALAADGMARLAEIKKREHRNDALREENKERERRNEAFLAENKELLAKNETHNVENKALDEKLGEAERTKDASLADRLRRTIEDNRKAVERNDKAIEDNRKAIERNDKAIEDNREAIKVNNAAIEDNRQYIKAHEAIAVASAAPRECLPCKLVSKFMECL
jgi:hypothetical protein